MRGAGSAPVIPVSFGLVGHAVAEDDHECGAQPLVRAVSQAYARKSGCSEVGRAPSWHMFQIGASRGSGFDLDLKVLFWGGPQLEPWVGQVGVLRAWNYVTPCFPESIDRHSRGTSDLSPGGGPGPHSGVRISLIDAV